MKSYCLKCGYSFSYKEKLKHYLFPFKYMECKCGKLYKVTQSSLNTASLITYLPLLFYLYSIDELAGYSYSFFLIFILWILAVWLTVPFFLRIKEVKTDL